MTSSEAVSIDLNRPMKEVLKELGKYPVTTRLSLNGTIMVARDIAPVSYTHLDVYKRQGWRRPASRSGASHDSWALYK